MRHEKPENSVVPGRTTSPNGSSKKRKERVFDIPGTGSECYVLWESDRQEFSSLNEQQGSEEDARLNLKRSAEQIAFHSHHDLQYQNYFSQVWLTSTVTSHGSGVDSVGDDYSNVPVQALRHMGPSSIMMTVAESTMAPNQQPGTCYVSAQYEKNYDAAQCGFDFQSFQRPGNQNCTAPDVIVHQATLHQVSDDADMYSEGLNGRLTDLSSMETLAFLEASLAKQSDKCETPQTVLQFHSSHVGSLLRNTCESKEQILTDGVETKQKPEMSDMEKSKTSLMVSLPSKNGCSPDRIVENDQKIEKTCVSLKVDETSKLSSGKPSSAVAEKLWDGRVQLSSSVTMSAVAFFKSGEKLTDISWSDFVEVKGKVRLEAFEKYIQDLPRSRSRGLMVISLCVKEGSSRTELTGMKEVSQGYKKGERVGFAQLSAGIDLYICPHTNTIITILAKYGFFKGMAAIEDNRDSLIGCVVWRKNQFSSNFTAKNLECNNNSSEQPPLDHLSGSSTHQVAEKKLAPIQTPHHINHSTSLVTMLSSPSLESAAENGRASKKINSSDIQLEVTKRSSAATAALVPVVPSNSSIIQIGQQMSAPFYEVCQGSNTQLRELEVSRPAVTGEQFKMSYDRKKDTTAVQSNGPRSIKPIFDEDDLPEYDFGTANRSNYIDVSLLARKLHAEGNWMLEGIVSPNASVMQARSTSSNGSDNVDLYRNLSAPNPGIPPPKAVGESPLCHNSEEKSNFERIATSTLPVVSAFASTSVSLTRLPNKNQLFDDDDDMPEWCPPEPYNRSPRKASKPLTTLSTELPNSSSGNISHVGPRPVILPPPPARFHSHFSYQPFGPALQVTGTISVNAPHIMPPQCSPKFSTSFSHSAAWGRQSDQPMSMAIQNGPGFPTGSSPSLALRPQSGQLNSMPIQKGSGFSRGFDPSK